MRTVLLFKELEDKGTVYAIDHALILFSDVGSLRLWFTKERRASISLINDMVRNFRVDYDILERFEGGTSVIAITFASQCRRYFMDWCKANQLEVYSGPESV